MKYSEGMGEKRLFGEKSCIASEIPRKLAVIRLCARKDGKGGFIGLRFACKAIGLRISSKIKVAAHGLIENCMNTRKPFVVPALAGTVLFRLKAVQQTSQVA